MDDRNSHAGDQLGGHRSIFQQLDFRKGSEEPPPTFGPDLSQEAQVRGHDTQVGASAPI